MSLSRDDLYLFDALAWHLVHSQPGLRDGSQRGRMRGAGDLFADIATLLAHPDPRRLDLRHSFTDPFGGFFVRRFERRTDVDLHILLDASASLTSGATSDRHGLAALLAGGLVQAARRSGDRAAVYVLGGAAELAHQTASRRAGLGEEVREMVLDLTPMGSGVDGLVGAGAALPRDRVLVALISDFALAPAELELLLETLNPRPVLPLWLRDAGLEMPSGRFGLAETRDPETGRRRTVLTTRNWAARQIEAGRDHREALRKVFFNNGLRPIEVLDSIDIDNLVAALGELPL